jgi:ribosomal protein L30/L7E
LTLKQRVKAELEVSVSDKLKTAEMLRLEKRHSCPIIQLIKPIPGVKGSIQADALGITEATLSKWRKRFVIKVKRTKKADTNGAKQLP